MTTATRDEVLRAVGEVAHMAALTDTLLFSVFARISDCPGAVAKTIYYRSDSMHQRADLVVAVAKVMCSAEVLAHIQQMKKLAVEAHQHRHKIAHSMVSEN
jgi:uncharacterized membrane protein (GlpM family)